jgi:putative nucleotidyltransferase with HDIG domain
MTRHGMALVCLALAAAVFGFGSTLGNHEGLLAAVANFVGAPFGWLTSLLLIPLVYTVYRTYQGRVAMARDRERHILETEALHLRAIEGLAMAIEAKDQNTHRHLMRVRVYVSELAKIMGLDKAQMQALLTASLLHDIGKLAVPEYIINKPGKLTPEEFDKMKIHPVVGADILKRVHFPYPVVPIVRSHHESWDGTGYPDGLKQEEIPIGARLLTAVDCFDALASDRPYRKALPVDQAMDFIKNRAGVQFDPQIVALLAEHYPRLERIARQQIQEMEPLKTDLLIERGAAPGAGFAEEAADPVRATIGSSPLGIVDLPSLLTAARREAEALVAKTESPNFSGGATEIGRALSRALQPFIPFDCCALFTRKEDTIYPCSLEGPGAGAFSLEPMPVGEGLSGWVALSQRSILNGNPTVEPNYVTRQGLYSPNSSALSVPIFNASGVLFAVLTLYSSKRAMFSREHLRILEAIQPGLATAIENAVKFEEMSLSNIARAALSEIGYAKNQVSTLSLRTEDEAVPALSGKQMF